MLTQHSLTQEAPYSQWSVSQDSQDKNPSNTIASPKGEAESNLFQRMMEGSTTQALNAVALIAPEEIIRKIERQKRNSQPSVFLARGKAKGKMANQLLSRFGSSGGNKKEKVSASSPTPSGQNVQLVDSLKRVFGRFCGLVVNSEMDLSNIERQLTHMTQKDSAWHPAQLYLVQVRVSHLSQKIEFFTSLMNKALESSKQIMNTQI